MKKFLWGLSVSFAAHGVFAAGFGIYEASSRGSALGGALVGATRDASAVYYNPANMTELTNVSVMVGATMINPFCDVKVDGVPQTKMNPSWFCDPTFYVVVPLPFDLAFGLGGYSEAGLGTKYGNYWALAGDTTETTLIQYSLNPNLAWKVTDWWSVGGGLKLSYIYFDNKKRPYFGTPGTSLESELEGDDYSIGYDFGTDFKITKKLSFGVVYRSEIKHNIEGDFDINGVMTIPPFPTSPYGALGGQTHSDASAKLTLPQSITAGVNYDASDAWRMGAAVTWTGWSSVDNINFKIPARKPGGGTCGYDLPLKWRDVFRFGFGTEYDFAEDWTARLGYVYDMDPTNSKHATTMLPAGDRHILSFGLGWEIAQNLRIDVGYGLIVMNARSRSVRVGQLDGSVRTYDFACRNAFSHLVSAGVTYAF